MKLTTVSEHDLTHKSAVAPKSREVLARAAKEFEAMLLRQLTSALNATADSDSDEDKLFGGDSGTGLSKQLFSEQLATSMAEAGGIGLSDLILKQFGVAAEKPTSIKNDGLPRAKNAIKEIRESSHRSVDGNEMKPLDVSTRPRIVEEPKLEALRRNTPATDVVALPNPASNTLAAGESLSYHLPLKGRISSGFGNRFHPIDRHVKFHAGLDIAVPTGTPVAATARGEVEFAGERGGYGNLVILKHPDGRISRYGHLQKILVVEGQQVDAGQKIALSGSTGKSTGPHLHFEIRENGAVVDPAKIVSNVLPKSAER